MVSHYLSQWVIKPGKEAGGESFVTVDYTVPIVGEGGRHLIMAMQKA